MEGITAEPIAEPIIQDIVKCGKSHEATRPNPKAIVNVTEPKTKPTIIPDFILFILFFISSNGDFIVWK